jgi:asparagine synthase (glutamine-hydrolysing)
LFAGYDPFAALGPATLYSALVPNPLHEFGRKLVDWLPVSSRNMSLDFRLRRALAGLSYPQALWNAVWMAPLEPRDFPDLFSSPLAAEELYSEVLELWREGEEAGLNLVERTLEFYTRFYLQEDVLMKVDRAAMMCSLETRAVFLDNDLVAFAERLPTRFKFCRGQRKVLLKKALAGALPPEILNRPKKGFGIPLAAWLKQGVPFPAAKLPVQINSAVITEHMQAHKSGVADHRMFLWASLGLAHNISAAARSFATA